MKWTFKMIMTQIFLTWLGRFGLAGLLIIVGGFMSPYGTIGELMNYSRSTTVWDVLLWIGAATVVIQTLIFMVYGWVINPLRDYRAKKKDK